MGFLKNKKEILVGPINYYDYFNGNSYCFHSRFCTRTIYILNFLMKKRELAKIISFNFLSILIFFCLIEIFFGRWHKNFFGNNKYVQIPNLIKDTKLKFNVKWMYSQSKPFYVLYTRDKLGYRSRDSHSKKPIVLTIGGSTTDNRYVSDGNTWQDKLDLINPKYDFVNGGVDGQSSYGHLQSIKTWHSKNLDKKDVDTIIFYIGINDLKFLSDSLDNFDFAQSKKQYIKNLLKDNSFFIKRFLELRNKINFLFDTNQTNINLLTTHKPRKIDFKEKGEIFSLHKDLQLSNYKLYEKIFSELIIQTNKEFPNSTIILIQQQIPGCRFIDKKSGYDRHPSSGYCLNLLKTFRLQEKILDKYYTNDNFMIYPMYLKNIIKDNDVYDYVHTNRSGANKIASYVNQIFDELDK